MLSVTATQEVNKAQHTIDCIAGYMYGGVTAFANYPDPGTSLRVSLKSAILTGVTFYYHSMRNELSGDIAARIAEQLELEDECWSTLTDPEQAISFGRDVTMETMRRQECGDVLNVATVHEIIMTMSPKVEFGKLFCKALLAAENGGDDLIQLKQRHLISAVVPLLLSNGYNEVAAGIMAASGMVVNS